MSRLLRWSVPLLLLVALGCNGPNGEKLGAILGDSSSHLQRELSREELASLPALSAIDVTAPLTRADYDLWGNHMQAFVVNVCAEHCLDGDPEALNTVLNTYRPDFGQIVDDLRDGTQSPLEVLRSFSAIRQAAWQDVNAHVVAGKAQVELHDFWSRNQAMWDELGYPAGPPDLAADAVRAIGITGEQGAQLIEIGVKMLIRSGRVVNPSGAAFTPGSDPFAAAESDEQTFMIIGNVAWHDMMDVFTSDQRRKAFTWYRTVDHKFEACRAKHRAEFQALHADSADAEVTRR